MSWAPPWLARAYARIYAEKKSGFFEFSEAGRILETDTERALSKTLSKLKSLGHLRVKRDPIDPRRKIYNLVDPESITLALAIKSKTKNPGPFGKLKAALGFLNYYVNGAYAAYQYHLYLAPGSIDISVTHQQLPIWIALISEKDVALSIDDVPAEKPGRVNVHLISDFDEKLSENTRVIDGTRYLLPEALIVSGLASERPSIEDVLAILVTRRNKLDWEKLLILSDTYDVSRFLGLTLDLLNYESRKSLFKAALIDKIRRKSNLGPKVDFPISLKAETVEEKYASVSSRWNVRLHLSHAAVYKTISDLVKP